ncbi:hypothetical protein X777_00358 [Ooceraea biroi]|uniref:Uncharacterized protein n=1 Tax=Ooceraea biroi TaxID=2015173 RepID=A0A026WTX5_OOCBI|nr:hypothetical protein X777_00358 [Ooceraea biroi]
MERRSRVSRVSVIFRLVIFHSDYDRGRDRRGREIRQNFSVAGQITARPTSKIKDARISDADANASARARALTRVATLQCDVGRHRHEGTPAGARDDSGQGAGPGCAGCGDGDGGGGNSSSSSSGCRGRGCRATCDAVTSANLPDRTRPPNYGLEFELAVNPFIALPPPPARQPPAPFTLLFPRSGSPPTPFPPNPAAGFSPVTHTRRTAARRRRAPRCVGVQCTVWRGRHMRAPLSI